MILIVDFGSQTAHLIGRRLRDLGVESKYVDPEVALDRILDKKYAKKKPTGIILSGGPSSVYENGAPTVDPQLFKQGIPVLGICYGWQLMAKILGGEVESGHKEYGPEDISYLTDSFNLLESEADISWNSSSVFMSHGDTVVSLPKGFEVVGSTKNVVNAAVQNKAKKYYGLQFHPEADHTEKGREILEFFVKDVCNENINILKLNPDEIIREAKEKVGDKKVICAVSGGVDSSVSAFLIGKAIGKNLFPIYVESGFMRPGTREYVERIFLKLIEADLTVVDAKDRFAKELKGVSDPEKKRKIIGKLYIDIFQEEAEKLIEKGNDVSFLGQGTIYSDIIESRGSKKASKIKSHHNVGGLPKDMKLELLEVVKDFYKDEVRELGRLAGIPEDILMQQPFPGPGYAIRIRGEVTSKRLSQVKIADNIVVEEIKKAGLYYKVFQCFAIMTGAYSTAVKGDARVFAEVVAIRAYESKDIMTSQWADIPYEVLKKISTRIVNEVPDISRVVYDITTKPPATMEWE